VQLAEEDRVEEQINFGQDAVFTFALAIDKAAETLNGSLVGQTLLVRIPKLMAEKWIGSDAVGVESVTSVAENEELHILVEKDFPCLDRPNEDKSDTFWELVPENEKTC